MPCNASRFALTLAVLVNSVNADTFLGQRQSADVSAEEVEKLLMAQMFNVGNAMHVEEIEKEISPMYSALPKTEFGTLNPPTVRYALHRYFVQKHGWYMKGLDPMGASYSSLSSTRMMKDKAPAYIQTMIEHKLSNRGMGLRELAVFAATLVDLVHQESIDGLQKAFTALNVPLTGSVGRNWTDLASKAYFMTMILMAGTYPANEQEFRSAEKSMPDIYPGWDDTYMWMQDVRATMDFWGTDRNPFTQQESFKETASFVEELGFKFGSFQNLECHDLKRKLLDMEYEGSGRVRLSRFYRDGVNGDTRFFAESVAYLRNLGALDETDPQKPSVMIPNYLASHTNCLSSSGFYSICCSDQCEPLLRQIEGEIGQESATPSRIAALVSSLASDTVDAPRNLSSSLLARLERISEHHGGQVPLHGRLFAQWLHHAYPRECPFPHVSGTVSPMTPWEWADVHGVEDLDATHEEMLKHHMLDQSEDSSGQALPWSDVEELISPTRKNLRSFVVPLRSVAAVIALGSFMLPLLKVSWRMLLSGRKAENKADSCFV